VTLDENTFYSLYEKKKTRNRTMTKMMMMMMKRSTSVYYPEITSHLHCCHPPCADIARAYSVGLPGSADLWES
jgi:hypothetical protein